MTFEKRRGAIIFEIGPEPEFMIPLVRQRDNVK